MRISILGEDPGDMPWLRDTHCADMPADMRFAILYGNEDSPEKVEAWRDANPDHDKAPDYVWPRKGD